MLRLLLLITLQFMCQLVVGWRCGGVYLDEDSICFCGDTNITWSDWMYGNTACCGRDTCYLDTGPRCPDGHLDWCPVDIAKCPVGQVCNSRFSTFRCGDTIIPDTGDCQCGDRNFTKDEYNDHKWCCPSSSSSCSYEYGNGICINGTVNNGEAARCPSGVTYDGHTRNYKDFFYCEDGEEIDRHKICLGTLKCKDGSDLDKCQENIDHCKSGYSKCPVTIKSTGHSQCYQSSSQTNDKKYDCLNRADESIKTVKTYNIAYDSLTICKISRSSVNFDGIKCRKWCKLIYQWCTDDFKEVKRNEIPTYRYSHKVYGFVSVCNVGDTSLLSTDDGL